MKIISPTNRMGVPANALGPTITNSRNRLHSLRGIAPTAKTTFNHMLRGVPVVIATVSGGIAANAFSQTLDKETQRPCNTTTEVPLPPRCCEGPATPLPTACCIEGFPQPVLCEGPCKGPHCPIPPPICKKEDCPTRFLCCSTDDRLQVAQAYARQTLANMRARSQTLRRRREIRAQPGRPQTAHGGFWASGSHTGSLDGAAPTLRTILRQVAAKQRSEFIRRQIATKRRLELTKLKALATTKVRATRAVHTTAALGTYAFFRRLAGHRRNKPTKIKRSATTHVTAANSHGLVSTTGTQHRDKRAIPLLLIPIAAFFATGVSKVAVAATAVAGIAKSAASGVAAGAAMAGTVELVQAITKRSATWTDPLEFPTATATAVDAPDLAAIIAGLNRAGLNGTIKDGLYIWHPPLSRTKRSLFSRPLIAIYQAIVRVAPRIPRVTTGLPLRFAKASGRHLINGAAMTGSFAAMQTLFDSMAKKDDYTNVHFAHIGDECWTRCYMKTGWCKFCGSMGRCCRQKFKGNGCDDFEGSPTQHICVGDPTKTTDLHEAYNVILKDAFDRNETSPQYDEFSTQLRIADRMMKRDLPAVDEAIGDIDPDALKLILKHITPKMTHITKRAAQEDMTLAQAFSMIRAEAVKHELSTDFKLFRVRKTLQDEVRRRQRNERNDAEKSRTEEVNERKRRKKWRIRRGTRLPQHYTTPLTENVIVTASSSPATRRQEAERIATFLGQHCDGLFPKQYQEHIIDLTYICILRNPNVTPLPIRAQDLINTISSFSGPAVPLQVTLQSIRRHKRAATDTDTTTLLGKRRADPGADGASPAKRPKLPTTPEPMDQINIPFATAYSTTLTDQALRSQLVQRGTAPGPVGPTTRNTYEKQLAQAMIPRPQYQEAFHQLPRGQHMLTGDNRLLRVKKALGVSTLPSSYTSSLFYALRMSPPNLVDYRLEQAQSKLLALHYVNFRGERPSHEPDIRQALVLMQRLKENKLLDTICEDQEYVDRHQKTVSNCEFKYALISEYLSPPNLPMRHPWKAMPKCEALAYAQSNGPVARIAHTLCHTTEGEKTLLEYINSIQRRRKRSPYHAPPGAFRDITNTNQPMRQTNGLAVAGRESEGRGHPNVLPLCETIARQEYYPRPLTSLALHNCFVPHIREVQTVLWYLTDQSHLLHRNIDVRHLPQGLAPAQPAHAENEENERERQGSPPHNVANFLGLPHCGPIARGAHYPRPLTALAIHNCFVPHVRQPKTVLWYLAEQAHLLQVNQRNLFYLPPQGPGHHDPSPPRPGPGQGFPSPFAPSRARRQTIHKTTRPARWDPLRFPEATATNNPTFKGQDEWRHLRPTREIQDDFPREASFQPFTEPTTLLKPEGLAAADVQMESVGITCPLQPIDELLQATLEMSQHRLQTMFTGAIPPPTTWRVDNATLPPNAAHHLIIRDRVLRLNRGWINYNAAMTQSIPDAAEGADNGRIRRATNNDEETHDILLIAAAGTVSRTTWNKLLHGSVHNQVLRVSTPDQSLAIPCHNKITALATLQQELNRQRQKRDSSTPTPDTLFNYLFSWVTQGHSARAHLKFAKHIALNIGTRAAKQFAHSNARAISKVTENLGTAFKRVREETWDADALLPDTLDSIAEGITAIQELTTSASRGEISTKHLNQIPWNTIKAKYAAALKHGYSPLYGSPFRHATAQATLSVTKEGNTANRYDILVWLPLIHASGYMSAYRIIKTPMDIGNGTFITLAPTQERILLVSRNDPDKRWIALSAGEFAACRPTGSSRICTNIRTTRPPVKDQLWSTRDADLCAYAIYAGLPRLAVTTCDINVVQDNMWAKALSPVTWLVFARRQTTLDVRCPQKLGHDRTRGIRIKGPGILRLPASCRAELGGWRLISSSAAMAGYKDTIDTYPLSNLNEAILEAQEAIEAQIATGYQPKDPLTVAQHVADILTTRTPQPRAFLYQQQQRTQLPMPPYFYLILAAVLGVMATLVIGLMTLGYNDLKTRTTNTHDDLDNIADRAKTDLEATNERITINGHRISSQGQRLTKTETSTKTLSDAYGTCVMVSREALREVHAERRRQQGQQLALRPPSPP